MNANARRLPDPMGRVARIAERLLGLRREHGLSQEAFGQLVGASQATVSRWEDPGSPIAPSAAEIAELAAHFQVDAGWLVGLHDRKATLPTGEAILDRELLEGFAKAKTSAELEAMLGREMSFGTVWVEVPQGAELVPVPEAVRMVKEVDRHVRSIDEKLWQRWAALVLR